MAASENFKEYVLDQLRELESVTVKKMFGGYGIYADGLIFGLIADDILYFKVDDSNRSDYELAGTGPFKPFEDKPMLMPYYEVPAEILEDRTSLAGWAIKALRVSASAPAKSWQKSDVKLMKGYRRFTPVSNGTGVLILLNVYTCTYMHGIFKINKALR